MFTHNLFARKPAPRVVETVRARGGSRHWSDHSSAKCFCSPRLRSDPAGTAQPRGSPPSPRGSDLKDVVMRIEVSPETRKALKVRAVTEEKTLCKLVAGILDAAVAGYASPEQSEEQS